jgi:membrane protein involved in colicin uptake
MKISDSPSLRYPRPLRSETHPRRRATYIHVLCTIPRGKRAKRDAREPSTEEEEEEEAEEKEEEEEEEEEEGAEDEEKEKEKKEEEEEASQSDAENNGDTSAPEESGVSMPRRSLRKINSKGKGKEKAKTVDKQKEKKPTTKKAEAKDAGKVGKEGQTGKAKAKDAGKVGKEGKTGKAKDKAEADKAEADKAEADKAEADKAEADKSGSASWTDDMTTTIVRKMLDMKRKGRQSDNGWKTGAWKEACDSVNHRYNLHLTVTQIKNKMTAVWL